MPATYTHTARLAYTGHYAVTSDAIRKPGKRHAANREGRGYRSLCGEFIPEGSDDHFMERNYIEPAGKCPVTCKRCLKRLAAE